MEQFKELTGANDQQARAYMEANGNRLEDAIAQFFDLGGQDLPPPPRAVPAPVPMEGTPPPRNNPPPRRGGIQTFSSLNSAPEDDQHEYFAGGGRTTGQAILGPPGGARGGGGGGGNDQVKDIFDRARSMGAQEVTGDEGASQSRPNKWQGTGQTLGNAGGGSFAVAGNAPPPQEKKVELNMWKEGFSIDDGPLRRYDDAANAAFMRDVQQGQIPLELRGSGREKVDVMMKDRREEDFVEPPKPKMQAFTGRGNSLGGESAAVSTPVPVPSRQAAPLDESKPTTSIQVRTEDGQRLVSRFNNDHTVGDLYAFVALSRPGTNILMTTFPRADLLDLNATLEEAGLLGAAVVQRRA